MVKHDSFRSVDEVLEEVEEYIQEFERKYGCSTEVMRQQFHRGLLDDTPEIRNWYLLAKTKDDVIEQRTKLCNSKQ
jgi:hypothetical protein